MPVRSLNSSVLRWPDRDSVHQAVQRWVNDKAKERPELRRVGYFGSYARGNWGVGSDLDLIIIVKESQLDFFHRAAEWDATSLPVPVDVLVYTEDEWREMGDKEELFFRTVEKEGVWIYSK